MSCAITLSALLGASRSTPTIERRSSPAAAERVAKRAAGEQRARELEERRAAERRERADRTEGPAARTRERSTRPRIIAAARGVAKERGLLVRGSKRRRATHLSARVGRIVVGLLRESRPRRGDG